MGAVSECMTVCCTNAVNVLRVSVLYVSACMRVLYECRQCGVCACTGMLHTYAGMCVYTCVLYVSVGIHCVYTCASMCCVYICVYIDCCVCLYVVHVLCACVVHMNVYMCLYYFLQDGCALVEAITLGNHCFRY